MIQDLEQVFGQHGLLAEGVGRFSPRPGQLAMAQAIEEALNDQVDLVVEAATGTGKTLAYLIPAILHSDRVIISTGTLNLQDQLFRRDLPVAMRVLQIEKSVALLKGRANYLCLHRLEQHKSDDRVIDGALAEEFAQVSRWAQSTVSGDIAELADISADSSLWPLVTSTQDNCLGNECPLYSQCHLVRARRDAQAADLVVVNHHLLFADLSLKQTGFGEVLPGADVVIIDEAHQIPETAMQFFSKRISAWQIRELIRDTLVATTTASGTLPLVKTPTTELRAELDKAVSAFATLPSKGDASLLDPVWTPIQAVEDKLDELAQVLMELSDQSKDLAQCGQRALALKQNLAHFLAEQPGHIRWFSNREGRFGLNLTPLNIAKPIQDIRKEFPSTWILTSATLAVANRFDHFTERLGLEHVRELVIPTPFNYQQQARLWIPEDLPEPSSRDHTSALLQAVEPLLQASQGRAFLLFTSHRALKEAAVWLRANTNFNLQVQEEASRATLLARFLSEPNSVLLGAASFWEGVDVPGDRLSVVMIDKLPFAPPDDPVLTAMIQAATERGERAFSSVQMPHAVLALKQGAGRLIRQAEDFGILVLGDTRLKTRGYGKIFLKSLPEMVQASTVSEAIDFMYEVHDHLS